MCHSETPDKESFSCFAKFCKIKEKMYASFHRVRGLGYTTVSEMLETLQVNDLFGMFPEYSNLVHILAAIPVTSCYAERSYSELHRLKTYLLISMRRYLPRHNLTSSYDRFIRQNIFTSYVGLYVRPSYDPRIFFTVS